MKTLSSKKEAIREAIAAIIMSNSWNYGMMTRAWCTRIAFKIVDLLEANGVNLDD